MKRDPMSTNVPTKKCKFGHVIPLNGDYSPITGNRHKNPMIACPVCALEAGGIVSMPSRPLPRGKKPEGQESFLDTVPAIEIRRDGQ